MKIFISASKLGYLWLFRILSTMTEQYSDAFLLQLISRADSKAFSYLYKTHFNMIRNLVEKNSGTADDASDLFQEVLIIIYEKVLDNRLRLTCSLKTYIYSIARNQWLNKLKAEKRYTSLNNFESFISIEEEPDNTPTINLDNLLNEIGEACRKLLILFYYKKRSMQEICKELNYSNADSVKNQKYKCMQRLKKMADNRK